MVTLVPELLTNVPLSGAALPQHPGEVVGFREIPSLINFPVFNEPSHQIVPVIDVPVSISRFDPMFKLISLLPLVPPTETLFNPIEDIVSNISLFVLFRI